MPRHRSKRLHSNRLPAPTRPDPVLVPLVPDAGEAAEEMLRSGQTPNTVRAYASAMRYWEAWMQLRYGARFTLPVSVAIVVQFIVDHVAREHGNAMVCELPRDIDRALVRAGAKGSLGPLKLSTVAHRLAVLSKMHRLRKCENPCADARVRHLLSAARRASLRRGEVPRRKTAAVRALLDAMLGTCDDSLGGVRDRALLLFAWASGGRRRSEVAAATVEQLSRSPNGDFRFRMGHSKTRQSETSRSQTPDKPITGTAARALALWLRRGSITRGRIFRKVDRGRVLQPLSAAAVGEIVKRRARKAGLSGDWGGHSLRSGFVTEAGRRKIPLGDIMALTEHRNPATVLGYYRSGELSRAEVAHLYDATETKEGRRRTPQPDSNSNGLRPSRCRRPPARRGPASR